MGDVAIDAPFISNTGVDLRLFKFKASLKIKKILHFSLVSFFALYQQFILLPNLEKLP